MLQELRRPYNIYIILWIIYYLQGTLYTKGSIISQSVLMLALLISIYYFYRVNKDYKRPAFFRVLNIFIILLTLYGIIYMISYTPEISLGNNSQTLSFKMEYLKNIYISLLPIYVFYYFSHQGVLTEKWVRIIVVILVLLTIVEYYNNYSMQMERAIAMEIEQDEFTNNIGYNFCAILPLLFFWRNKVWMQYLLLFVCVAFIVMGMKRGAIFISALCVVYFLYNNMINASRKQRFSIILISLIAIIIATSFVMNFASNSEYFQNRLDSTLEGNSSGRDELYDILFNFYIGQANIIKFLVGCGANYTIAIVGNYAHNDWLELAINQGLLGLVIYFFFYIGLNIDRNKLLKQKQVNIASSFTMAIVIMLLTSFISMAYADLKISTTLGLGYCLGQLRLK